MKQIQAIPKNEVDKLLDQFETQGLNQMDHFQVLEDKFVEGLGQGPDRQQVRLKMPEAAVFFVRANGQNVTRAIEEIEDLVERHNSKWSEVVGGWVHGAVENCRGTIRYWKLERGFSKIESKTKVGYSNMLLDPYFTELNNLQ
jgi:hypothetical protein